MKMLSGECALIIDGRRFDHCTCALESDDAVSRPCGFLSAPFEVLDKARAAKRVRLVLHDQQTMEIRLLAANAGIAMFVIAEPEPIRATLTARRWVVVIEGSDVREVCIRAEQELMQKERADTSIHCRVTGADSEAEATIVDYVAGLQLAAIDSNQMAISADVIRTLRLARIEHTIRRAEQLISRQRRCVEALTRKGLQHDLSAKLLDNLTVSLTLLHKHRDLVRRQLVEAE